VAKAVLFYAVCNIGKGTREQRLAHRFAIITHRFAAFFETLKAYRVDSDAICSRCAKRC
jgi:hypothetical protein